MRRLDQAWETGGHFERLHMFACGGHDPDWFKQYIQYEEAADVLKMYHGKTVPALAQTQTYAEALLKAAGRSAEAEAESRARMKRQKVLRREIPPYLWILIDQEVLENVVGGPAVMAEQLRYLISLAEADRVCVRIVARVSGRHPGHDGHFQVMTINGRGVSYAVAQVAGRLIEAGDESSLLEVRFDEIGALALPRADSQTLMKETLRTYE